MKIKLFLLALLTAVTFSAQAQDGGLKATAGSTTAEIGVNLTSGTFLQGGQIRLRRFATDEMAYRLGVGVAHNSEKISENANRSNTSLTIAPGVEKHFAGTNRLSPYVGAELPISFSGARYEDDDVVVRGANSRSGSMTERGAFGIGLNVVAGMDFYIAQNFFTGFEFGAGLGYRKNRDVKYEFKSGVPSDETIDGYHSTRFNVFSTGGIRIGFVF
ncbi:BT1926 family outer membrane beta-barrel protein [Pontibacter beigongshangensis]|uniref:BT1926 family outer membrane beta-barrel protein n=1 Tax=Pontibacter beigongshangensis TaxID=2574733 RepID=UPI00164F3EC4|nr:BT1926 family outer membrane beta-barrel protein [Pontibacter beigongshangensis]